MKRRDGKAPCITASAELLDSRLWRMHSSRILGTYDEVEAKLASARDEELVRQL
jgi:hypothetical protein